MPEGTDTPEATFTFKAEKVSYNGGITTTDKDKMPTITDKTIEFKAEDNGVIRDRVKEIYKEVELFTDPTITFSAAGVYTYKITEQRTGAYNIVDATKESLDYSQAEYQMTVYVKNGVNGPYIYAIGTVVVVVDNDSHEVGDKVDVTPGNPSIEGDYSDMIFTNTYLKSKGGVDPKDPAQQGLSISKVVSGDFASHEKYFDFDVAIEKPATIEGAVTYTAYVVDKTTNVVVTSAANGEGMQTGALGGYFTFTAGTTPKTISLKHHEKLVFVDTHVGTRYTAVERAVADYVAAAQVVVNGGTPIALANTADSTALSTLTRILGDKTNSADFTNTYKEVTPAGLDISNLPFIIMLIAAGGSLVALLVTKSRKRSMQAMQSWR
jgi:hypothetical protein